METATSRTGFVRGVGDLAEAVAMRAVTAERLEMRVEARVGEAVIIVVVSVVVEGIASVSASVIAELVPLSINGPLIGLTAIASKSRTGQRKADRRV